MIQNSKNNYLVLGQHPWNEESFNQAWLPNGNWFYESDPTKINLKSLNEINPKYIFVLHWSKKLANELIDNFDFIIFHMTDLPFGRGGSPLQNLITLGKKQTVISAIKAEYELDSGDVYLKRALDLTGSAHEIYVRASRISMEMAIEISEGRFHIEKQLGKESYFERRKPEQSEIPQTLNKLETVFDFIRMLDAPGYPNAFIEYGNFTIHLTQACIDENFVTATARIELKNCTETEASP